MTNQKSHWVLDPTHCKIGFSVKHFGIAEVEGCFKKFNGNVFTEKGDFRDAVIDFSAEVGSISTEVEQRDTHLASADFFDAQKYPLILFKSKTVQVDSPGNLLLIGELSMRGLSREISLKVSFNGIVEKDPFGNTVAGFKLTGVIDRKDWGVSWNTILDHGGVAVSNEVNVICHVELKKVN